MTNKIKTNDELIEAFKDNKNIKFEELEKDIKKIFPNCELSISNYSFTLINRFPRGNIAHQKVFMRDMKTKNPELILKLVKLLKEIEDE
jgi:hypothetical protein